MLMYAITEPINTGTELEFIPIWVAEIWRLILFCLTAWILGHLMTMPLSRYGRMHYASKANMWFHMSLTFAITMSAVVQVQRFDNVVVLEGLVTFTVLVFLTGMGVWHYRKCR